MQPKVFTIIQIHPRSLPDVQINGKHCTEHFSNLLSSSLLRHHPSTFSPSRLLNYSTRMHQFVNLPSRFLTIFILGSTVRISTDELTEDKENIKCPHPMLPGLSFMANGVDITKVDLFNTERKEPGNGDHGFRDNLFAFTCKGKLIWTNRHDPKQTIYSRPDQVETLREISNAAGSREITLHFASTQDSVKTSMAASLGIESKDVKGSFSASASYMSAKENLLQEKRSTQKSVLSISTADMSFTTISNLPLSVEFKDMLATLPATYEEDPAKYALLLTKFGTHFLSSAHFGGVRLFKTVIENKYMFESSEKSLRANLKAAFVGASGKMEYDDNSTTINSEFTEKATVTFHIFGGKYTEASKNKSSHRVEWANSVYGAPCVTRGTLEPLENLISNNPALQAQIKKATWIKLRRVYASDLVSTLKLGQTELPANKLAQLNKINVLLDNPRISRENQAKVDSKLSELFRFTQIKSDRKLLNDYVRKLEDSFTGQFIEAKWSFTVRFCLNNAIEGFLKEEFARFDSFGKQLHWLNSTDDPDNASVTKLIHDSARLIHRHEQIDGFCNENLPCQACTKTNLKYENNMRRYGDFYLNKMYVFLKTALKCKIRLAEQCAVKGTFLAESEEMRQVLADMGQAVENSKNRPVGKFDMQQYVKRVYASLTKLQTNSVHLCSTPSCQQCIESHIDLWNSHSNYSSFPCRSESEWKFLNYTPKYVAPNCTPQHRISAYFVTVLSTIFVFILLFWN